LGLGEIRLQGIEESFQVLATGMGHDDEETEMGWVGSFIFFNTYGVILQSEEYCSDEIPKFLTRKKCVVIWQPEQSCATRDLACFNLFMFLSPRVRYSRVL
jgi:hypothetical protein